MRPRRCKDCGAGKRPAPYPGPRCATHHRDAVKASKKLSYYRWIRSTYGLTGEQYEALYDFQGGKCAICKRATGRTKRLAVDHDHVTGYVRGLLCGPCNRILGHLRDDLDRARGLVQYLSVPPAQEVIGKVKADG